METQQVGKVKYKYKMKLNNNKTRVYIFNIVSIQETITVRRWYLWLSTSQLELLAWNTLFQGAASKSHLRESFYIVLLYLVLRDKNRLSQVSHDEKQTICAPSVYLS